MRSGGDIQCFCEFNSILKPQLHPLQDVQCCDICGLLAHDSCVRRARHDCKPLALEAEAMPHLWKAAGVLMPACEVSAPCL